ncbi:MAG TPA: class I SAM-dependent methyltransferase [Rubrobacteraceae bacterium]|nr:class I SAM-dependent methyltransferase [Rubrobacteraceae bacterium]
MSVRDHNREAWDREVERGNQWTVPAGPEVIEAARQGRWKVLLTNTTPVPKAWFPDMEGLDVLCLASGGGQQGPVFAAAGANVTVLDNSPKQLAQDRLVAERDSLTLETVQGDMADLSRFDVESFDLVFHPVSNLFVPDVRPVWAEAYRVLRRGGSLLAGILNPVVYIFDLKLADRDGELRVRYTLPYADATSLSEEEIRRQVERGEPLEFGHTLDDQIGGQIDAGFLIAGFYEDRHGDDDPIAAYMPTLIATRAIKP